MQASTAENLVSLFRSASTLTFKRFSTAAAAAAAAEKKVASSSSSPAAAKKKPSTSSSAPTAKKKPSPLSSAPTAIKKSSLPSSVDDAALKKYVSSINISRAVSKSAKHLLKSFKAPPFSTISSPLNSSLHGIVSDSLNSGCRDDDDESAKQLLTHASNILYDEMNLDWDDENEDEQYPGNVTDLQWLSRMSNNDISLWRKVALRERKQKWVARSTQVNRFHNLINVCTKKIGPGAVLKIFGRLGRETGLKEYNALIKVCMDMARETTDEDVSLEHIYEAYQIFKKMREKGFKIHEETYGQFLLYLIDFGMVEEFFVFHDLIKEENPDSLPRLPYYEMLLWVRVNKEAKIQELCHSAVADDAEEKFYFRECLLLALGESDRKQEFLMLLKTLDITKVSSDEYLKSLFRSLGKLFLEPFAEKFLLDLKGSGVEAEKISNFICEYAISIPNLQVEDIIVKFQTFHTKLEVLPTSAEYAKLIRYCCEFLKVHEALNVVDEALKSGVALSLETFHLLLDACYQSCELNLVHQINSKISCYNVNPNTETFRRMILLCVKMKDFEGAYRLIDDLQNFNLSPTTNMYNAILAGYFREKDIQSAMRVLKQMEVADLKPDALTYSHLISNSHCEKDIMKVYDDMRDSRVEPTKHVFMALINAYASCGLFERAKQVILDKRIPVKNLNEMKNVLVGALASNGQLSSALNMYEEIKNAECNLNPKAIKCLIEHFQSEGELNKALQLLEELNNSPNWTDACFRVISHCVRHENLRLTIDLLKQLMDKFINAEVALEVLFDEVFCLFAEKESKDMQFGLDLLQGIKEELGVRPSRKSLDFLLTACTTAQDSRACFAIWKEYKTAGLPYNVLSFVRMYQALLASGDQKSAAKILQQTPKDDPHVCDVIKACEKRYMKSEPIDMEQKKKKKKKKRALVATLGQLNAMDSKIR